MGFKLSMSSSQKFSKMIATSDIEVDEDLMK